MPTILLFKLFPFQLLTDPPIPRIAFLYLAKKFPKQTFYYKQIRIQLILPKTMISYKIITQELYDNLAKLSADKRPQRAFLIQSNTDHISKVQQFQAQIRILQIQLKQEKQKNKEINYQLTHLQSELNEMSQKIAFQSVTRQQIAKQKNETTILLEKALKQKKQIMAHNSELVKRLSDLQPGIITINKKNQRFEEKYKLLQSRIQQMKQIIGTQNAQKQNLLIKLHQKQQILGNLNFELNKNAQLLEKILGQYEGCKQQKLGLESELQKYRESPIPKLQQKITTNQSWIVQLTKNINELRQRCVELEMDRPSYQVKPIPSFTNYSKASQCLRPNTPYSPPVVAPYISKLSSHNEKNQPNTAEQTFFANKSKFEETQRIKYLTICKRLFQQFNSKLSKIQQQKKSMQEKFQSLKLKLNEYQYNQFKYKDKISLYLQKIQRYEKLTEKQQSEMQNLVLQFDQELNNIIKTKEQEVRSKFEEEVSKYQTQLQRLKDQEQLTKKLEQQAYQELIKHETIGDSFDHEMLKQLVEQAGHQLAQKSTELETLRDKLNKKNKELQKYKQSKQSYKQKALALQQECHHNSTQIRRLKGLIQELIQEFQIESNQKNRARQSLQNQDKHLTNRSDQDSRLRYGQQFNENLSGNLSLNKNLSAGKISDSQRFEYQFSQIDVELQRRNDFFLNQFVMKTRQEFQNLVSNNASGPSRTSQHSDQAPNSQPYWKKGLRTSVNDSMDSINKSQISSQSQNDQKKQKEINSGSKSSNSSVSSKNSYQSYGMRSLYRQKTNTMQNWGHRFLQHNNSLQ